jgi:hypothetical protein
MYLKAQNYPLILVALKAKNPVNASEEPTKYQQEILRLLSENNSLLREIHEILKDNRERINKIEDYTRGIKSNTSTYR